MASGGNWWFIVGCYIAPNNVATINRVVTAIGKRPCGDALLVSWEFNTYIATSEGSNQKEEIVVANATTRLEVMSAYFLLYRKYWAWDGRIWCMLRLGREVRSRTDYIMGTDIRLFRNVSVHPWHNSDHFMVLGCLHSATIWEHTIYLGRRWQSPLRPMRQQTQEDQWFTTLWQEIPKPPPRE